MAECRKFYCLGVPRSGTTYFTNLLNSHENIFCGMESFFARKFKAEFLSTENFVANIPENKEKSREYSKKLLQSKSNVQAIGDKNPRSYYEYNRILDEMEGGVVFVCLRDAHEIFHSWNSRAGNPNDTLWDPGLNWFIAYLEIIALQHVMTTHDHPDVYLVNYSYLVQPETRLEATRRVFELLGLAPERETEGFLAMTLKRTISILEKERERSPARDEILNTAHMRCYAELLDEVDITPVAEVKAKLEEFSACLRKEGPHFLELFDDIVLELKGDPSFMSTWRATTGAMRDCFTSKPLLALVKRADGLLGTQPPRMRKRRLKSALTALFRRGP